MQTKQAVGRGSKLEEKKRSRVAHSGQQWKKLADGKQKSLGDKRRPENERPDGSGKIL